MPELDPSIKTFTASDGYDVHYRHWVPRNSPPIGFVVALHGIQSHSGWYESSSRRMCEAGWDVRFLDRRGSGRNQRDRGHADHRQRLVNDVAQFLTAVNHERGAANLPIVLLAVSWGGKPALATALQRGALIDGLALLYPGLKAKIRPNIVQKSLLRLAMAAGKTRRHVKIPLDDPALFAADPVWQQYIRDDKLALHEATVSLLHASVCFDHEFSRIETGTLNLPVLLMLAGQDRIIDNAATSDFVRRISSTSYVEKTYENASHTLEFESNRDEIFADLIAWLQTVAVRPRN